MQEKNAFESTSTLHIPQDPEAVQVTQAFASFLVAEARSSRHAAASWEEESALLVDNWPVEFTGKSRRQGGLESDFEQTYFFPSNTPRAPEPARRG